MMYKKILIAVDNSSHAMLAAQKGFGLASQLGAEVDVLSVADPSREVIPELVLPTDTETHHDKVMTEVNSFLNELTGNYPSVVYKLHEPEGSPKKEILAAAEALQSDMIVLGSHGRTGLRHLLMGSVAEYVIRNSSIPVMVVSAGE